MLIVPFLFCNYHALNSIAESERCLGTSSQHSATAALTVSQIRSAQERMRDKTNLPCRGRKRGPLKSTRTTANYFNDYNEGQPNLVYYKESVASS